MIRDKSAILFDLDGTLVDTAPDMVRVLAELMDEEGQAALPYEQVRAMVSNGSLGLVRLGFPDAAPDRLAQLQAAYLERYAAEVCRDSRLFPDLPELLAVLDSNAIPWGVVTNKPSRMTHALLEALALDQRASCVVSGDTLPQRKPDPAPLLLGARQAGVAPERSVYIGDALRDIDAGRSAGMSTIAAAYGYIVDGDSAADWHADAVAADTRELARLVAKAVNLQA